MKKIKTADMLLCALFAALSAVLSQLAFSVGPIPINLTHISIFLAAGLLGAKYGALSQIIFVLLGAAGIPVFSNFQGGIGHILGRSGGFIIGYIGCAFLTGLLIDRFGRSVKILPFAMISGMFVSYTLGTLWFMYITNMGFAESVLACVAPFLPGDSIKIILASVLVNRLRPVLHK